MTEQAETPRTPEPLTAEERDALRLLALNALEDGAWHNAPFLEAFIDGDDEPVFNGDDTAFIAAVTPSIVLRLLADRDRATRSVVAPDADLRAALAKALAGLESAEWLVLFGDPA